VSGTPENVYFSVVKAVDALLPFVEAALAAQEASPQPDLAREWFEKGFQAGLSAIDKFGEQHDTAEEAYLACRQEQP
jgi:hypothetical protein